ncbi:hypothetical protein EV126DRAFT_418599 [Verticillium dahliae]|nr:hypothetical protein EV126DRAFT_418599 [Verticillium dahliae]
MSTTILTISTAPLSALAQPLVGYIHCRTSCGLLTASEKSPALAPNAARTTLTCIQCLREDRRMTPSSLSAVRSTPFFARRSEFGHSTLI